MLKPYSLHEEWKATVLKPGLTSWRQKTKNEDENENENENEIQHHDLSDVV